MGMTTSFGLMQSLLIFSLLGFSAGAQAAIPRANFIVEKMAKQSGNGTYQIEQDVTFTTPESSLTLRETWLVSMDGQMRVTVKAPKEHQNNIRMQFVYGGGQRHSALANGKRTSTRISDEFLERWLHTRSTELLFNQLANLRILPASYLNNRPSRGRDKSFVYPEETQVRPSRTGGVIAYSFGELSTADSSPRPMAWIEQDVFRLRRLRFPSGANLVADNFGTYARSLALPKLRHINWNQSSAEIQVAKVTALPTVKGNKLLQAASIDVTSHLGGLTDPEMQRTVEEFYSRFR